MKNGIKTIMRINFPSLDMNAVSKIKFKFVQGSIIQNFTYPSSTAVRVAGKNAVDLTWTIDDSFKFNTEDKVEMDTFVTLSDSQMNPETKIVKFKFNPTLFTKGELTS